MKIKAILFDLSGVLFDGNALIDGAPGVLSACRKQGLILRFVTNTATLSSAQLIAKLAGMGIIIDPSELFSAPIAARQYLQTKGLRPYCLIHPNLQQDFAGFQKDTPNAVLLGDAGDDLNYANLNHAFQLCQAGAPLIAIGKNRFFRADNQLMLDAGAFVHAIEWAAGCQAIVMGKPGIDFFRQVAASTGLLPEQCLMVGDDVEADVLAAQQAGLNARLVRTGKYQQGDEERLTDVTQCIGSVNHLLQSL